MGTLSLSFNIRISPKEAKLLNEILSQTGESKKDFFLRMLKEQTLMSKDMDKVVPKENVDFLNEIKLYAAMINATATSINATATTVSATATQINHMALDMRESSIRGTDEIYNVSLLLRQVMNMAIVNYRYIGKPIQLMFRLIFEHHSKSLTAEQIEKHNEIATKSLNKGMQDFIDLNQVDHINTLKKYNFI